MLIIFFHDIFISNFCAATKSKTLLVIISKVVFVHYRGKWIYAQF